MLAGLAGASTKALGGGRFSLVNVVPTTLLVAFVVVLAASGLYGSGAPRFGDVPALVTANAGLAVLAVFAVFLLALLLRPFQAALVQLLEGYWGAVPGLSTAAQHATETHRRILARASAIADGMAGADTPTPAPLADVVRAHRSAARRRTVRDRARRTINRYPRAVTISNGSASHPSATDDRLLPTLLGNTLRDAEDQAGGRYGYRLPDIAPRLYPHVSERLSSAITQSLDLIDTTAALSVSFGLAGLASLPLVGRGDPWSLVPLVAFLLAVAAYRGAVRGARTHARLLATAVDLHRFDMLSALHYELPATVEDEHRFATALSAFLGSREPAVRMMEHHAYDHASGGSARAAPGDAGPSAEDGRGGA